MLLYLLLIIMPILLQGVPGLHTQKMVAIGSAVFAGPWNGRTDRRASTPILLCHARRGDLKS